MRITGANRILSLSRIRHFSDGASLNKAFLRSVKPGVKPEQYDSRSGNSSQAQSTEHVKDKFVEPGNLRFRTGEYITEFLPKICVFGVGGGGCNAVNNMIARKLSGVEFVCANTDAQHLSTCLTENKLQLGKESTQGLGCGANPESGRRAAEESKEEIARYIADANMVFITAGMGGGTGTGAAPVVAEVCMEKDILTVAVVTKPFSFEGKHRARLANEGIRSLEDRVDTLIIIPNQNIFKLINASTSMADAFGLADDILLAGVKSITDLMVRPGLINLDFADVRTVMSGMGHAIMGTGQAEGEDRAIRAANDALNNPLLGGDFSVRSAKGMLVNITGGKDLTLVEVDAAAQRITSEIEDEDANVIFGSSFDESLQGSIRVSIVATGIEAPGAAAATAAPVIR
uniref:FtsZ n=1 Tax=Mallomonas splendens TaxID=52552 RepID=Q9M7M6_9STRA|nr:FtsZ [Mallomonas splendens]